MPNIKMARSGRTHRRRRRSPQLGLRAARGQHGGYRAHAGRPRGRSPHYVPHLRRPEVTERDAVHVTLRLVDGLPSLRRVRARRIIEAVFRRERERRGFRLVHYAIRRNHLHLVCEADETQALSRGVQRLASPMARKLNRLWSRRGGLFSDRFHARVIKSPRDMRNVLSYVLLNEHKNRARRGEVVDGVDLYSSGLYFDGWSNVGPVPPPPPWHAERSPPVVPPRSWLLGKGWRRHGLIRTTEKAPQ